MSLQTIPAPALIRSRAALYRWLFALDPEDDRRLHRAAPQVALRVTEIRLELNRRRAFTYTQAHADRLRAEGIDRMVENERAERERRANI